MQCDGLFDFLGEFLGFFGVYLYVSNVVNVEQRGIGDVYVVVCFCEEDVYFGVVDEVDFVLLLWCEVGCEIDGNFVFDFFGIEVGDGVFVVYFVELICSIVVEEQVVDEVGFFGCVVFDDSNVFQVFRVFYFYGVVFQVVNGERLKLL